jgi:ribosomal protein L5
MIRIKEHYLTVVREEMVLAGSADNTYEVPAIAGITLHISLKPFHFNLRTLGPRMRAQELAFGVRPKMTISRLSDLELGTRKGAVVGMRASKFNAPFVYDFRDRILWNMVGLSSHRFSGWHHRAETSGSVGFRTVIPVFEYDERDRKDPACMGLDRAERDWSIHFSNHLDSEANALLLQGMALPFDEPSFNKPRRKFRSKTVRKFVKKLQKQQMKKNRA